MKQFFSRVFISIGILSIGCALLLLAQHYSPWRLSFSYSPEISHVRAQTNQVPVRFQIPSVGIDLPVVLSQVSKTSWGTTDKGISYLATSPFPGSIGNSIFYGHNWTSLMGNLVNVHPGETMIVMFSDHTIKKFTIKYTITVTSDETHILNNTSDRRITVYTCTGFLDSKRFVAVGELQ